MGGLRKVMKITFITFLISSLAISGIPPFSGFFSKDEILMVAFHQNIGLWVIASLASIMTAFYMFRLLYLTFFKHFRGTEEQKHHLHESPALITFPLIVLAILAAVGGIISLPGNSWLAGYLAPIFAEVTHEAHHFGTTEYALMGIAVVGGVIGIVIAYIRYIQQSRIPSEDAQISGFKKVLYNKYYVDEFYTAIIVKPINAVSKFSRDIIEPALSRFVYGFGTVANAIGTQGKTLHNGSIGFYLFAFVLGVSAILIYLFFGQKFS
jgi:NADH-quinone oxidoreductase subunit L